MVWVEALIPSTFTTLREEQKICQGRGYLEDVGTEHPTGWNARHPTIKPAARQEIVLRAIMRPTCPAAALTAAILTRLATANFLW